MKRNQDKTKEQLINELSGLRQRIVNLEALGRKREEEKKLESADKYRNLAESLSELIYCADPKTFKATYINSAIESFYGYTVAEWLNDPSLWKNLIHPDDKEMVLAEFAEAQKNLVNAIIEYRIVRKDNTFRWVEDHVSWEKDQRGKAFSMNGVMYDVTERKHLEQELIRHRDYLEELVEERTAELESANEQLRQEIIKHKRTEEVLRESKELFEKTFATQIDAIFILDTKSPPIIIDCNPATTRVFGHTRQEMLGRPTAFLHKDEATLRVFQKYLYPAIEESGFLHLPEFAMKRKDGTVFPTEHTVVPIQDQHGKRIGWVSVVRDITKRKRAEEALQASENNLQSIISSIQDVIFALDKDLRFIDYYTANKELFYTEPDKFIGKKIQEVMPEDYLELALPIFNRVLKTRQPERIEYSLPIKGITKHFLATVSYRKESAGRDGGLLYTAIDITERKQAEGELRERDERLNLAQKASNAGFFDWDLVANRMVFSKELEELYGFRPGEFDGTQQTASECVLAEDQDTVAAAVEEAMRVGEYQIDYRFPYRGTGETGWMHARGRTIYDEQGKPIRLVGINVDITERKKAEEQLRASLREKDILLREVHHRVKNNLQVVSSILDLYGMRATDPEVIYLCGNARSKIHSMAIIHSQLYTGDTLEEIDLKRYIPELVSYLFQVYKEEGTITPVIKVGDVKIGITQAVPYAIALNELVTNALIHAFKEKEKGIIKISVERLADGTIRTAAKDDGIGMPPEFDIAKVDTMGLKLVRNVVQQQLKGEIHIKRDKGTEFIIEFKP